MNVILTRNYGICYILRDAHVCFIIFEAIIIFIAMNVSMLIRTIESLWHAYIYVVCSSLLHPGFSARPGPGPVFHMYVHLRTARSPWIQVGASPIV